jgi:hypothetical protein
MPIDVSAAERWWKQADGRITRPVHVNAAELTDIVPPSITRHDLGFGVPGIKRFGPVALNFQKDGRYSEFMELFSESSSHPFTIQFPDGTDWKFEGFITDVKRSASIDGLTTLSIGVRPTKQFVIRKKEERMFPKGARHMPAKPPADLQSFYIGSNALPANWTHADLKTAVAHATELVNDRDGSQDEVFIVKIVKVVRRKEAPVTVTVTNFKPFKAARRPRG